MHAKGFLCVFHAFMLGSNFIYHMFRLLHTVRLQFLLLLPFIVTLYYYTDVFYLRIKLSNVAIRKSNVSLLPEHGLRITADKASGNIGAVWHYKESSWFVI